MVRAAAPVGSHPSLRLRAAWASVAVATILIAAKLAVWLITGSVALLSSLVDSTADLMASVVTLVSVRHALRPADRAHRFGHGKAEPLAALVQAGFVTGSMLLLSLEATRRLLDPRPVAQPQLAIAVMLFAILLTALLVAYQRRVIRRTGSIAITADRFHYAVDLVTNLAVIVAILLTATTGILVFDPLFALLIAAWMLKGAIGIARRSFDMLMDRELPEVDRRRIEGLVLAHPEAHGVHDMRSRRAGPNLFIELHLELEGRLTLARAHAITHEIEDEIREVFPAAEVLIHQEPHGLEDERLDARIAEAD